MSNNDTAQLLKSATTGFDHLFSNEITDAQKIFAQEDSPFHLLGQGVCTFLEAALSMETGRMAEATERLTQAEAGAKKHLKVKASSSTNFPPGTEWEVLHADIVILLGLTNALSESYMGYLQCIYALNNAHSKFSKIYKTVFPNGLGDYATPSATPAPSRKPSNTSLRTAATKSSGLFGRWGSSSTLTVPTIPQPNGPIDEMIIAGASFGYGLFNLVFSLLPRKIQSVVGFFGYQHDRKLALQALAVSAAKQDVHSVFAGLVLMTYYGVVLLLAGYQADETHIVKQYRGTLRNIDSRFPKGALWVLNRAKIHRYTGEPEEAIRILQEGLAPDRKETFPQADTMLVFELAWVLMQQRRYQEAADQFIRMTELNSWSHATYYYTAAGCHVDVHNYEKAQELFDKVPDLLARKGGKVGGKDLPTEVLIRKKLEFYKEKAKRKGVPENEFVKVMQLSPADEMALFWNTHSRLNPDVARALIEEWSAFTPPVSPSSPSPKVDPSTDLDTPDELAIRALLLGIVYRTLNDFTAAKAFLTDALSRQSQITVSTWVGGMASFELAVTELKEAEWNFEKKEGAPGAEASKDGWAKALKVAGERLDGALSLAGSTIDLSSRLDSRIAMLKDEVATKKEMLGMK